MSAVRPAFLETEGMEEESPRVGTRRSLAGAASFGVSVAAVTGLFALASFYLARTLPTAEFGRVAFGLNVHLLLLTVAGLGLSSGVMAEIAGGRGTGEVRRQNVEAIFTVRVASAGVLLLVGAVWAGLARDVLPALAAVTASLFIVQDFLVAAMAGQLRTHAAAAATVVQPVCYVVLLLVLGVATAEGVLLVLAAALAIALAVAVVLNRGIRIRLSAVRGIKLGNLTHATSVARYAYAMTFLQIGLFVGPIILLGASGRYAAAAALSILMALVRLVPDVLAIIVSAVYFPRMTAAAARGADGLGLYATFARLLALVSIPAAIGLAILGGPLLSALFAGKYDSVAPSLVFASLLIVLLTAESLLSWSLVAAGAGRIAIAGLGARLSVVLAGSVIFVLEPGAAPFELLVVSYVAGSIVSLSIQLAGALRIWRIRLPIAAFVVYAVSTGAACLGVRELLVGAAPWPATGVLVAVCVGVAAVVGVAILVRTPSSVGASSPDPAIVPPP